MKKQPNKELLGFRDEINKIDEKVLSLLQKRMKIVDGVAKLKTKNKENFFIKSAREADMIKELLRKFGDDFPKETIINIWREIITASNMHEQPIQIAVLNPNNISDYDYMVREYYSSNVPIKNFSSTFSLISEIEKGQVQIGVFALPNDNDGGENWWINLANNKIGLKVFAKIPFIEYENNANNYTRTNLLTIAIKEAEKSKDDNSLLYVEVDQEITKPQILSSLKQCNLAGKILKYTKLEQVEGVGFYLIELDGFFNQEDVAIKNFSKLTIKPYIKILGHYPKAVIL